MPELGFLRRRLRSPLNPIDTIQRPGIYPEHPDWTEVLKAATERVAGHGDLARWQKALNALPELTAGSIGLEESVRADSAVALPANQQKALESALRGLHPWRKGPFELFGLSRCLCCRRNIKCYLYSLYKLRQLNNRKLFYLIQNFSN